MSYDIEIYAAHVITTEELADAISDADGHVDERSGVASRLVRGERRRVFVIDGPLRVEREDLPPEVAAAAVGVRVLYEITVEDSARPSLSFAKGIARALAEITGGVVHDRQNDARPVWSPFPQRRFKPPAAKHIDVVELIWQIRREDLPDELPTRVLESLRTWIPEALPQRFGDHEPLQHTVADEGEDGFVRAWRAESVGLHWKPSRPFLSGGADGVGTDFHPYLIGEREREQGLPHPIASLSLTFDMRILSDERWRSDVVKAFVHIAEVTGAFYAHAVVERGWGYSGGTLWTDGQTETHMSTTSRNRWMGLPPYPVWLAWFNGFYEPLIENRLGSGSQKSGGPGLLWRGGDHPDEVDQVPWPEDHRMSVIEYETRSPDTEPAAVIPEGL